MADNRNDQSTIGFPGFVAEVSMCLRFPILNALSMVVGVTIALAIGGSFPLAAMSVRLAQQENEVPDQLEPFLEKLQLPRLRIRLLEKQLVQRTQELERAEVSEIARQAKLEPLAKRLLELYAKQLMQTTDGAGQWLGETESLLRSYPNIATSSVRVAVMQAAYQQNELAFRQWRTEGAVLEQVAPQLERWRELIRTLDQIQAELQRNYDDQLVVIQSLGRATTELNDRLAQLESQLAHTEYLLGWGRYFLGVLDVQNRRDHMLKADFHFREFLQIDQQQLLSQFDAKWIDWRSSWNSRAVAGLAMVQRSLDRVEASKKCFAMVLRQAENVDAVYLWRFNSRIYINDYVGIDELIGQFVADRRVSRAGRARFWLALADAARAIEGRARKVSRSLRREAIAGLATEFQASALRELIEENPKQWGSVEDPFLQNWVNGYLLFDALEVTARSAEYQAVEEKLNAALKQVADSGDAAKKSRRVAEVLACRFVLAQIKLAQNQLPAATTELLRLSEDWAASNRQYAMQAHWLAIGAIAKQSRLDRFRSVDAIQEIDRFRRRFPGSSFDSQAELLRMKLVSVNLTAGQAIERWESLPAGHIHANEGKLEIARMRLSQWLETKANDAQRDRRWSEFRAAIAGAAESTKNDLPVLEKVLLLQAKAMAINEGSDLDELKLALVAAREQLEQRNQGNGLAAAELASYEVMAGLRADDLDAAQKALSWLDDNAPQSRFRRNSLISVTRAVDKKASAEDDPALKRQAVKLFEALIAIYSDGEVAVSDARLLESANARVAHTRLAFWYLQTERADLALTLAQRLVKLFPKRTTYVRLLAQSLMATGDYKTATRHWRALSSAATAGSDAWWEAKLGVVAGLSQSGNVESAKQLIRQTELLSPDIPVAVRASWNAMASKLGIKK